MTVRQNIAKNIRTLRHARHMTQDQLAKVLGLHRPAVSDIEAMRRGVSVEECIVMADAFGVPPERVYGQDLNICPACGQSTAEGSSDG